MFEHDRDSKVRDEMSLGYPQEHGGSILIRSYGRAMRCQGGNKCERSETGAYR